MDEDLELQRLIEEKFRKLMRERIRTAKRKFKGGVIYHLDYSNFNEFINEFEIAVVDFWAEWCPPCYILSETIEELANEHPDVGFGKVNFDENRFLATSYDVMSLPTVIIFKNSRPFDKIVGAVPKEYLESMIIQAKRIN